MPSNIFQFRDYLTNDLVTFDSLVAYQGGNQWVYTKKLVPNYRIATPIYAGTIERNSRPFRSPINAVTVRTKVYDSLTNRLYGRYVVQVLDNIPYGVNFADSSGEVVFYGDNIQITPKIADPNCHNYPTSIGANPICYFRVRAYRPGFPSYHADWIFYFLIKTDWSSIRDEFILESKERFSFDQTNIIDNQQFLNMNREKGYYL